MKAARLSSPAASNGPKYRILHQRGLSSLKTQVHKIMSLRPSVRCLFVCFTALSFAFLLLSSSLPPCLFSVAPGSGDWRTPKEQMLSTARAAPMTKPIRALADSPCPV